MPSLSEPSRFHLKYLILAEAMLGESTVLDRLLEGIRKMKQSGSVV